MEEKSKDQSDDSVFSTRDLTLAATLVTLKFPVIGIDYQILGQRNRPIGYFKFSNTPSLKDARQKFAQSLLSVEPSLFMTSLHRLKAEVEGFLTNPNNRTF